MASPARDANSSEPNPSAEEALVDGDSLLVLRIRGGDDRAWTD